MGVQRYSETLWRASKSKAGVHYIGMFESEKDAALAYDVYARQEKQVRPVNFTSEKIIEVEMKRRKTKQGESIEEEPVQGKKEFVCVHWQQQKRERWLARFPKKNIHRFGHFP
jgi:hypothetical protein